MTHEAAGRERCVCGLRHGGYVRVMVFSKYALSQTERSALLAAVFFGSADISRNGGDRALIKAVSDGAAKLQAQRMLHSLSTKSANLTPPVSEYCHKVFAF